MSPRPKKPRNCACPHRLPGTVIFKPAGTPTRDITPVELFADELEALRLCDHEGLNQSEAGERMGISRGTVQRLVAAGRKKVAGALVNGGGLLIQGDEGDTDA